MIDRYTSDCNGKMCSYKEIPLRYRYVVEVYDGDYVTFQDESELYDSREEAWAAFERCKTDYASEDYNVCVEEVEDE